MKDGFKSYYVAHTKIRTRALLAKNARVRIGAYGGEGEI